MVPLVFLISVATCKCPGVLLTRKCTDRLLCVLMIHLSDKHNSILGSFELQPVIKKAKASNVDFDQKQRRHYVRYNICRSLFLRRPSVPSTLSSHVPGSAHMGCLQMVTDAISGASSMYTMAA